MENNYDFDTTGQKTDFEGDYITITLGTDEKKMQQVLRVYNILCKTYFPDILGFTHYRIYEIYKNRVNEIKIHNLTPQDFKMFLQDTRVTAWIQTEYAAIVRTRYFDLLKQAGEDRSTATVQALTAFSKLVEDSDDQQTQQDTTYIYSFMPLSEEEGRLNNVYKLESIPTSVRNAIQHEDRREADKDSTGQSNNPKLFRN
jgi:hypothetical protein